MCTRQHGSTRDSPFYQRCLRAALSWETVKRVQLRPPGVPISSYETIIRVGRVYAWTLSSRTPPSLWGVVVLLPGGCPEPDSSVIRVGRSPYGGKDWRCAAPPPQSGGEQDNFRDVHWRWIGPGSGSVFFRPATSSTVALTSRSRSSLGGAAARLFGMNRPGEGQTGWSPSDHGSSRRDPGRGLERTSRPRGKSSALSPLTNL